MKAKLENLYRDVKFLTSLFPFRNHQNIESLNKAAEYIKVNLKKTGLATTRQLWQANGNIYQNIIASYLPSRSKRLLVGAHYDVYKDSPGADDNASSVAALLEMARIMVKNAPSLDYGIDFIFFSLEEPPFFKKKEMGSNIHAHSIGHDSNEYIGMIALEMLGYYGKGKTEANISSSSKNLLIVSGIKKYDAYNKKVSQLLKSFGALDSRRLSYADNYRNNGPSDHRNYWQFDIPAVMVIGTGGHGNPNYHTIHDTIDTLDFEVLAMAVDSLLYAVLNLGEYPSP